MRYNIFIFLYREENNFFAKIIFFFVKFTKFIYGYIVLNYIHAVKSI